MNHATTTHTGPLGSTIHCLRADAETVRALAAIDWNRSFRRVCLDPVRGLVTLMAPSRLHELWRLHGRKGTRDLQVDFLALLPGEPPRTLPASALLGGLTDNDVCEAVDGVRFGMTLQERIDAVARIVRRRQRASVRVREADAPYAARSG